MSAATDIHRVFRLVANLARDASDLPADVRGATHEHARDLMACAIRSALGLTCQARDRAHQWAGRVLDAAEHGHITGADAREMWRAWDAPRVPTPSHVYQEGRLAPMSAIWPDAPTELAVVLWDEDAGVSWLAALDGTGGLDLCTADYPPATVDSIRSALALNKQ